MRFFPPQSATLTLLISAVVAGYNNDTFNYLRTSGRDFGPEEWNQVSCDDPGVCMGWPDAYESRVGWNYTSNQCVWCPDDGSTPSETCAHKRQSPINLERSRAIPNHENYNQCLDDHAMEYLHGSCRWRDIVNNTYSVYRNNFKIDRHALKIMQPLNADGELMCSRRKFPRIDFARGYPEWWYMYQTEVKMPSEHAQEGRQYDAEVQLDHSYAVDRNNREIGKVAIFLHGYEGASKWDFLEKLICQWREVEEETREACCLASVPAYGECRNPERPRCDRDAAAYPTPNPITRVPTGSSTTAPVENGLCTENTDSFYATVCSRCCTSPRSEATYCHQVYESYDEEMESVCRDCCEPSKDIAAPTPDHQIYPRIECGNITEGTARICHWCCNPGYSESDFCLDIYHTYAGGEIHSICWYCCSEPKDLENQRYLRSSSNVRTHNVQVIGDGVEEDALSDSELTRWVKIDDMHLYEDLDIASATAGDGWNELRNAEGLRRHLVNYEDVNYDPYDWLKRVRTEYYFRYEGTQTVPPCHGRVHWRVMKDPIPVHPEQIRELQRLLARRIAPPGSPLNASCTRETAGTPIAGSNGNAVKVNRPLQSHSQLHKTVFCECRAWDDSIFPEDLAWCSIWDIRDRFYRQPYNFDTNGNF